ncbi:hypothetical protein [Streptomyces sp. NPDC058664]|uniref:hypothetical protein n=1 Tax=unclassified Streptomyces TaxID=2593676 RepID=UPI00365EBE76
MTRLLRGATARTPGTAGGERPDAARDEPPEPTEKKAGTTGAAAEDGDGPGSAAEVGDGPGSAGAGTDGDGPEAADVTGRRSPAFWRKAALVTAVAALLLGGGAFFHAAHQLRSTPSARNLALTDTGATTRVSGDVGEGLARVFSYAPASADAAERSARTVLAGRAARQYGDLFAQVRASLVEQRVTLTTQAVRTGVIELDGDSARLLVFLDQTSRRDKAPATSAAAQLTVTARFQGDRWLIVDIKAR